MKNTANCVLVLTAIILLVGAPSLASAQANPPAAKPAQANPMQALADSIKDAPAPPAVPGAIPLPVKGGVQQSAPPESWISFVGKPVLRNVSQPTLTPVLPPPGKRTGAALIVAPGGGFMFLTMANEGYDVANFLASQGIAAFVLKYRLVPTPKASEMGKFLLDRLTAKDLLHAEWFTSATKVAAEDAQEAMRLVRTKSAEWGVDPRRVGFVGFSAGAFTAMALVKANDPATNPDFVGYVYGSLDATPLPSTLPPLFIAISADDPFFAKSDFGLIKAWQAAKIPVELHSFDRGGHGWGYAGAAGTTTVHWSDEFVWWIKSRGFLETAKRAER